MRNAEDWWEKKCGFCDLDLGFPGQIKRGRMFGLRGGWKPSETGSKRDIQEPPPAALLTLGFHLEPEKG